MKNCWPHFWTSRRVQVACCCSLLGSGSGRGKIKGGVWVSKTHARQTSPLLGQPPFVFFDDPGVWWVAITFTFGSNFTPLENEFSSFMACISSRSSLIACDHLLIGSSKPEMVPSGRAFIADAEASICHSSGWMASSAAMELTGCSCRCQLRMEDQILDLPHEWGYR